MRNTILLITIICTTLITCSNLSAEIINVPDDFETIQGAINESEDGDSILVSSGEYVENIDFDGKDIVVIGDPDDPYSAVIDGDQNGSVALFTNGESRDAILNGFLLLNGSGNRVNIGGQNWYVGGAVFIQYARPTIENCIMLGNSTENAGGGMFMWGSGTTPLIRKCQIIGNSSSFGGGLSIRDNCNPVFVDTEIIGNEVSNSGGGLYLDNNGYPTFERCIFRDNVAAYGAGMSLWDSRPTLINCTIVQNRTTWGNGGGLSCMDASNVTLRNCICWDNEPYEINALGDDNGHHLTFEYSDIEGGRDGIRGNDNGEIVWGDGNIDEDPEFVNPNRNDYTLTDDSPCIDTGDPESDDDPDGTRADMGAFYFHQRDIAVEPLELSFGLVESGQHDSLMITISNTGRTELQISAQSIIPDDTPFMISQGGGECEIAPESEHESWIRFAPLESVEFEATLRIESDDPDEEIIEILITGSALSVRNDNDLTPIEFGIVSIHPNPFNATTTITYSMPSAGIVELRLFDLSGREVTTFVNERRQSGIHTATLIASDLPSGLYFVRLKASDQMFTQKVMLIR
ncbi:MAG: right-handed parallel beta-helix repeat-containing protein [Calditrichaeota bacterium]|nr:right-handed parallel beta-helix repeat-containing protein [Calditrichota bacterium]